MKNKKSSVEENGREKERKLLFLTVNSSYSHSGMVMALLHQAAGHVPFWSWKKWEITLEEDSFAVISSGEYFPCDLLCATLYLFNREKTLEILERIHALYPQIHIAVGGPECSSKESAEKLLREHACISTVFSGEGEEIFTDFLQQFDPASGVRRILPPNGEKTLYEKWSSSPCPVEDPFFRTDRAFVQMETSRGCPMGCSYCTSSGVRTRYRSLKDVERELTLLREKGVTEIRVLDRTFNLPRERGAALLQLFGKFAPQMHFHLEIHPQFLDESLRKCLASMEKGVLHIEAGMQSLSPEVQRAVGRNSVVTEALDGLRFLCSCRNFETHVDLLSGLPAQTYASLCHDIVELMQCAPAEIQLEVLKILPGTKILSDVEKYSIAYNPNAPYDVMRSSSMSPMEILKSKYLSRLLDLFYNHKALHEVMLCAVRENPAVFLELSQQIMDSGKDPETLLNLKKRFLYLAEFLEHTGAAPEVRHELITQWLLAGYPLNEGPAKGRVQIAESLPEEYTLLSGEEETLVQRESKFYLLREGSEELYFVYNRKYRFNGPCCICRRP